MPLPGMITDRNFRYETNWLMPSGESFKHAEYGSTLSQGSPILDRRKKNLALKQHDGCWKELTDDVQRSLDYICSVISKYSSYHYSTNRSTLQFKSPNKAPIFSENKTLDAFTQTLLLGRLSSRDRLTKGDIDELFNMDPLIVFSNSKECEHLDRFCHAFEEGLKRRRLLVTENGLIGSAPQTAEEGDVLCVLYGCSVPVILRKFQDENFYEFVGECYLHGFMDAEAIALHIKGVLEEQEFVLM
jgi:hypothetical protein